MKKSKLMEFVSFIIAIIILILLIAIPSLVLLWIYSKLNINISLEPHIEILDREWVVNTVIYFVLPICLLYYIPVTHWINRESEKISREKQNKEFNDENNKKQ